MQSSYTAVIVALRIKHCCLSPAWIWIEKGQNCCSSFSRCYSEFPSWFLSHCAKLVVQETAWYGGGISFMFLLLYTTIFGSIQASFCCQLTGWQQQLGEVWKASEFALLEGGHSLVTKIVIYSIPYARQRTCRYRQRAFCLSYQGACDTTYDTSFMKNPKAHMGSGREQCVLRLEIAMRRKEKKNCPRFASGDEFIIELGPD